MKVGCEQLDESALQRDHYPQLVAWLWKRYFSTPSWIRWLYRPKVPPAPFHSGQTVRFIGLSRIFDPCTGSQTILKTGALYIVRTQWLAWDKEGHPASDKPSKTDVWWIKVEGTGDHAPAKYFEGI